MESFSCIVMYMRILFLYSMFMHIFLMLMYARTYTEPPLTLPTG